MGSFWIVLSTFFISCAYVSIKAMPVSMAFYEIFLLRSIVVLSVAICLVAATKTSLKTHEPALQLSRALCGVGALSINNPGCSAYSSFYGSNASIHRTFVSWVMGFRLVSVQRQKDSLDAVCLFCRSDLRASCLFSDLIGRSKCFLCRPRPFVRRIEFGFQYFVAFIRTKR